MSIDTFLISSSSPNARSIRDVHGLIDGMHHRFPVDVGMRTEVEARGCDHFVVELIPITVSMVFFRLNLKRGSGWIVERFHKIDLMVTDYNPISARS